MLIFGRIQIEGDIDVTYWSYLLIRSIADIFPVSIIVLLNTAVIIATRETSTGRSEIGRQLAWGALAWGKKNGTFSFLFVYSFFAGIICFFRNFPLNPRSMWHS